MAVKGQTTETKNSFVTGVAEVKVLAFNPTSADYEKIYGPREVKEGKEGPKEPEYVKQDTDGNTMILATFLVEDVLSGKRQKLVFPIVEKVDFKEHSGNTLFVNDQGQTTYVDVEENLKEYFTGVKRWSTATKKMEPFRESKVRKGFSGEKALLDFLSNWLNLDFSADDDTEIWLNMEKLFAGDFRELRQVVNDFPASTVGTAWHVNTKDADDGTSKQSQQIYRGAFFNTRSRKSNLMAIFNTLSAKEKNTDWANWVEANSKIWDLRNLRNFITQVTGDYGPEGFTLQPLGDYDPAMDLAASQQSKHGSEDYETNSAY